MTLKYEKFVNSVAWSPDGTRLASGSWDNTVMIWDPVTGKILHTLLRHSGDVKSVAWSHDGALLASGSSDKTVNIWLNPKKMLQNYFKKTKSIKQKMLFLILMALKNRYKELLLEDIVKLSDGNVLTLNDLKGIRNSFPNDIRNLIGKLIMNEQDRTWMDIGESIANNIQNFFGKVLGT